MNKKSIFALSLAASSLLFVGCANLMDKAVVGGGSFIGGKFTTNVDASSGTPIPLPTVIIGEGNVQWVDMPVNEDSELDYYSENKSMWSSEVSQKTYIRIRGSAKAKTSDVKITIVPDKILAVPGLAVTSNESPKTTLSVSNQAKETNSTPSVSITNVDPKGIATITTNDTAVINAAISK